MDATDFLAFFIYAILLTSVMVIVTIWGLVL